VFGESNIMYGIMTVRLPPAVKRDLQHHVTRDGSQLVDVSALIAILYFLSFTGPQLQRHAPAALLMNQSLVDVPLIKSCRTCHGYQASDYRKPIHQTHHSI
jgi:hypothetical protein